MGDGAYGRRHLLFGGALFAALLAFVAPAAAQGPTVFGQDLTVFGLPPLVQAAIAALFLLNLCIIMMVTLDSYTERTTDVIVADPRTALVTGFKATLVLFVPYIAVVTLLVAFDAIGIFALALLSVLAIPLLGLTLTALGVGLIAAGRRASDKEGVQLAVVTALSLPIGAFPIPFALIGAVVIVFGLGGIVWDLRYGESDLDSRERETYGRQHRYL